MKKYFILLLFIVFIGCTTKPNIYVDGIPMPHSTYNEIDTKTNIRVEATVAEIKYKKNDNGDIYKDYKYLEIGESYKNSNFIIYIKITNPDRLTYQIQSQYHYHSVKESNYRMIEKNGYKGNAANKQ